MTTGICAFGNDKHYGSYTQPDSEEWVGNKHTIERDTIMAERLEPAGAIIIECVKEYMQQHLQPPEESPIFQGYASAAEKPLTNKSQQWCRQHYKQKGMGEATMRQKV
jgi:hypothetical protein